MSTHFAPAILTSLGGSPLELAVVCVAVLVLFGAKSLPGTLRTLGKWSEQLRRISREFQQEIADAGEPLRDAQREWEDTTDSLRVNQEHNQFSPRPAPPGDAPETGEATAEEDPVED